MREARWWPLALAAAVTGCAPVGAGGEPAEERLARALSGMVWPLEVERRSAVVSGYGERQRRHHDGVDIPAPRGRPIHAAAAGRVVFSGWKRGYGNTVVVDHGEGVTTLYAHAAERWVEAGHRVTRGEPIAAVGATGNASGNHLHFEIAWAGVAVDPVPLLPRLSDAARRPVR